jgi:hypothetical protein
MAARALGAERSLSYFDRWVACTASADRYPRRYRHLEPDRSRTFIGSVLVLQRGQLITYSTCVLAFTVESPRESVSGTQACITPRRGITSPPHVTSSFNFAPSWGYERTAPSVDYRYTPPTYDDDGSNDRGGLVGGNPNGA